MSWLSSGCSRASHYSPWFLSDKGQYNYEDIVCDRQASGLQTEQLKLHGRPAPTLATAAAKPTTLVAASVELLRVPKRSLTRSVAQDVVAFVRWCFDANRFAARWLTPCSRGMPLFFRSSIAPFSPDDADVLVVDPDATRATTSLKICFF